MLYRDIHENNILDASVLRHVGLQLAEQRVGVGAMRVATEPQEEDQELARSFKE